MARKVFFSQRLDALVERVIEEMDLSLDPMETKWILVPNSQVRQWLLLEIAKRSGIAMGLKVMETEQLFPETISSLEIFCRTYSALLTTEEPELIAYLDGKKKRILDLTETLTSFFLKYSQYESLLKEQKSWQLDLFRKLFLPQKTELEKQVICFGIDYLSPVYWEKLLKLPSLSIYLFSPCAEYWEDLSSNKERKALNRFWKKRGIDQKKLDQLDTYLRVGPQHLANWGKLGRMTLNGLDDFESEEHYVPIEPDTLLKQIQSDFLQFKETKELKIDDSIQIIQTGSSRLREIEVLKEEILRLDIPYHEISVLAPDIEPYVPLVEYVFGHEIPFRISGFDVSSRSSFRQGLIRLLKLGSGRWDHEEILALFETPAFYRKKGWDREILETFRTWISSADIQWGIDESHRKKINAGLFQETTSIGTWEKGLDVLLDLIVYLKPLQINPDLFEELIGTIFTLKELDLQGEKKLSDWAISLEKAAASFLEADGDDEADMIAQNRFQKTILEMKKFGSSELYPFELIEAFLMTPSLGQMHGSQLHAIRFSPIEEGAMIPAKALFLIGMDEMSFPRMETPSSLDHLLGKIPKRADFDRYLFLQSIFSATEMLRISYGHLSEDEGKPVGPSLLVQELISMIGPGISRTASIKEPIIFKKHLPFPIFTKIDFPSGEITLSIHELRQLARHPWKFFLQKVHKIYLNDDLEETFVLQRGKLIRAALEQQEVGEKGLRGPLKKAMDLEVAERVAERKAQLAEWQIELFSLVFRESCKEPRWEENNYVMPALVLHLGNLTVKLVGEIKQASHKGIVSFYDDNIAGTLKIWPEALICAVSLNGPSIWFVKNGKSRTLQNPEEALKAFIEYYFHSLKAPSPLIPEWADAVLRKGSLELAKKMERGSTFEDPVMEWVFARSEVPSALELMESWNPLLKATFSELLSLYPVRGEHAKI